MDEIVIAKVPHARVQFETRASRETRSPPEYYLLTYPDILLIPTTSPKSISTPDFYPQPYPLPQTPAAGFAHPSIASSIFQDSRSNCHATFLSAPPPLYPLSTKSTILPFSQFLSNLQKISFLLCASVRRRRATSPINTCFDMLQELRG